MKKWWKNNWHKIILILLTFPVTISVLIDIFSQEQNLNRFISFMTHKLTILFYFVSFCIFMYFIIKEKVKKDFLNTLKQEDEKNKPIKDKLIKKAKELRGVVEIKRSLFKEEKGQIVYNSFYAIVKYLINELGWMESYIKETLKTEEQLKIIKNRLINIENFVKGDLGFKKEKEWFEID